MASPMVQINVRVPPALHERLLAEVLHSQATVTTVVTKALVSYLGNLESGGKGK